MKLRIPVVVVSILATLVHRSAGAPAPLLDVSHLTEQADMIVVGTVVSISEGEPSVFEVYGQAVPGRLRTVEFRVDWYLKGSASSPRLECRYFTTDRPEYGRVHENDYRVFFLSGEENNCGFSSPYYLSLPAVPMERIDGDTPLERVSQALVSVLHSSTVGTAEKSAFIRVLATLRTPEITAALRKALEDPDRLVSISAASAALSHNDLSGLQVLEKALVQDRAQFSPSVLINVRGDLATVSNVRAIPFLSRIFVAEDPLTRRSAAQALRNTRSDLAIPTLVRALDDSDQTVRYTAVIGLAEITGNRSHAPSMETFARAPEEFVGFWKVWAAQR